ncbi:hypothetical protein J14TS2_45560 [Bacillus sp. J14TS2]|uniref:hypothetical protein n=1 Tax=Bacillus sp. J14TS2 TaxID=2807188 RepID=UPI001B1EA18D|nr:hypothetical protein [Bacillus sp. J14TS2]GIN74081.1 hypothetical protein J14TS2_45560 [Bacillus sp. J14TS2]
MKAIMLREVRQFFNGRILLLLFGCCLFGFTERRDTSLSYEQFILNMIAEHYYLTYFMIPVFLLFTYKSLEEDMDYVLIRSRYYWKYFLAKASGFFINIIGFVGFQFVAIMLVGIGLQKDNSFSLIKNHFSGSEELFIEYAKYFHTPLFASSVAAIYMVVGLTVLFIVFLLLHHFLEKKIVLIVMITLYFFMTLGIKVPGLNRIPFFFMDNYIILHHNFTENGKIVMSLISMLLLLIVAAILVKYFWRKRLTWAIKVQGKGITFYYARYLFTKKNAAILLVILLFISLWRMINISFAENPNAEDFFLSMFYGHGVNEFHMLRFIEMLILNGGPLYLFAIFIESISNEQSLGLTIRLKYKRNWVRTILQITAVFITFYVVLMIGIGVVLCVMNNLSISGLTVFLIQLSILKFLDILFQFFVFLILFTWKKNVTMAFLIVLATNGLSLFPVTWMIYFPTGLSSMARSSLILGQAGVTFQIGVLILGSCVLLQWAYIKFHGYKKVLGG